MLRAMRKQMDSARLDAATESYIYNDDDDVWQEVFMTSEHQKCTCLSSIFYPVEV